MLWPGMAFALVVVMALVFVVEVFKWRSWKKLRGE